MGKVEKLKHKWAFAPRFRRNAFGWKSQPPIKRIKEAVSEIKKVPRKDPLRGGEGAVLFLGCLGRAPGSDLRIADRGGVRVLDY